MIDGRVSIYTEGPGDDDANSCLSSIQEGMSGGNLLSAHSAIKGLTYVGTELPRNIADDSLNDDLIDDNDISPQQDETIWMPAYTIGIVAASSVFIASAVFVRYRAKRRTENANSEFDSSDWEDESVLSSLGNV